MKKFTNFISILAFWNIFISSTFAQVSQAVFNKKGQSYALIVGISSYENDRIPALQFAHEDATFFADFLKSEKGGSIPEENIRLLTNEQADIGSVYNALDWLKTQVKENDQAYFYFSGHGDIETLKDKKLGYLLAYNSPPNNYPNNAISLEEINKDANFISLNKKGKMVLILDACHSGVLAGDFFKGKQFVNKQLQTILNNEVRLTACAASEEAAEGVNWGGGRGAFSYYLLKGLNGFAEKNNDQLIVIKELQSYMDSCFVNDQFLISQQHPQKPIIDGHPEYPLAFGADNKFAVFRSEFLNVSNAEPLPKGLSAFSKVDLQAIDLFFNYLDTSTVENDIDFDKYEQMTVSDFSQAFVNDLILLNSENYLVEVKNQLNTNKPFQNRFSERFVEHVHKRGQNMINDYLQGNLGELRKRDYYNLSKEEYVRFLGMLNIAKGLVPEEHHLAYTLHINFNYLSGLIARIQMATSKNLDSLLTIASKFQNEANKLEPYAAYIQNELGNLAALKKNYAAAEAHFKLSTEIAPTWAIPWVNLISVYAAQRNLPKAKLAIQKAEELQPNLEYKEMNAGLLNELENNWLSAESNYLLAIEKNKEHFFPYERLGFVNIKKADFKNAQFYFKEAEKRKQGINEKVFKQGIRLGPPPGRYSKEKQLELCQGIDTLMLQKGKGLELFFYGFLISNFENGGYDSLAVKQIVSGLQLNPKMPLAKHILGKMYFKNGDWQNALRMLTEAQNEYLNDKELNSKLASIIEVDSSSNSDFCLLDFFGFFQYDLLEDGYLLAEIYQNINQKEKAIKEYSSLVLIENNRQSLKDTLMFSNITIHHLLAAYKLALLYENLERYDLAEKTFRDQILFNSSFYAKYDYFDSNDLFWIQNSDMYKVALYSFYERMVAKFPRDYQWQEKIGLYIHGFFNDSVSIESFIRVETSPYTLPKRVYFSTFGLFERTFILGSEESINFSEVADVEFIAYKYLNESIKLNGNQNPDIQVLQALAELAPWVGKFEDAFKYHNEVLNLEENQNSRNALIKLYNYKLRFPEALSQLKALNQKKQLDANQKIQFVQYSLLSNNTKSALQIMNKIDSIDLENLSKNYYLFYNLTGKEIEANLYLKKSLNKKFLNKTESLRQYGLILQNSNSQYIKARQYALMNNSEKAVFWLKKSINSGFIYVEVLQNDAAWDKIRTKKEWKNIMKHLI